MRTSKIQTHDEAFALIEATAIAGARCPMNRANGGTLDPHAVTALVRTGRIRIEISGHNWRCVIILTGPHAGAKTAADPTGAAVWKVIEYSHGRRTIKNDHERDGTTHL